MSQTYDEIEKKTPQVDNKIEVWGSQFSVRKYIWAFICYFPLCFIFSVPLTVLVYLIFNNLDLNTFSISLFCICTVLDVGVFALILVNLILRLKKHNNIYFADNGARIGRTYENSVFIPWDKVTSITSKGPNCGSVSIHTSLPHDRIPKRCKSFTAYNILAPRDVRKCGNKIFLPIITENNGHIGSIYTRRANALEIVVNTVEFILAIILYISATLTLIALLPSIISVTGIASHLEDFKYLEEVAIVASIIDVLIFLTIYGFLMFRIVKSIVKFVAGHTMHRDIFLEKDGFRVGKSYEDSRFISWGRVTKIKTFGASVGKLTICTSLYDEKNPRKNQKYVIYCLDPLMLKDVSTELKNECRNAQTASYKE